MTKVRIKDKGTSGPPKSMAVNRSKAVANRLATTKGVLSPLEVMIDNMQFFHRSATGLLDMLVKELNGKLDVDDEQRLSLLEDLGVSNNGAAIFNAVLKFKRAAQGCAVDAAPYMHPKLATVTHNGSVEKPVIVEVRRVIVDPKQGR